MIYHYCGTTYNHGSYGGVARFDHELRKVFPDMISFTPTEYMKVMPQIKDSDIVITDNGMCNHITNHAKCIVVHHGSAIVHKKREPSWNGDHYVSDQKRMKQRTNNVYVAPSTFMKNAFWDSCGLHSMLIRHSCDLEEPPYIQCDKPVILGDWRDNNKGSTIIPLLKQEAPEFEFRQLKCGRSNESKESAYSEADIYLTLSLSEGCSYSQLDALACNVPVLSTDVSLFGGDCDRRCGEVISWKDRSNVSLIISKLKEMLGKQYEPRQWFDKKCNFETWSYTWRTLCMH